MGTYGFVYEGEFDLSAPVRSVRHALSAGRAGLRRAGRRGGVVSTIRRLAANVRAKREGSR